MLPAAPKSSMLHHDTFIVLCTVFLLQWHSPGGVLHSRNLTFRRRHSPGSVFLRRSFANLAQSIIVLTLRKEVVSFVMPRPVLFELHCFLIGLSCSKCSEDLGVKVVRGTFSKACPELRAIFGGTWASVLSECCDRVWSRSIAFHRWKRLVKPHSAWMCWCIAFFCCTTLVGEKKCKFIMFSVAAETITPAEATTTHAQKNKRLAQFVWTQCCHQ